MTDDRPQITAAALPVFAIAKPGKTAAGNPITFYWTGGDGWSANATHAATTSDHEQAQQDADQWSDYWTTKGYGIRAHVAAITTDTQEPTQ